MPGPRECGFWKSTGCEFLVNADQLTIARIIYLVVAQPGVQVYSSVRSRKGVADGRGAGPLLSCWGEDC